MTSTENFFWDVVRALCITTSTFCDLFCATWSMKFNVSHVLFGAVASWDEDFRDFSTTAHKCFQGQMLQYLSI